MIDLKKHFSLPIFSITLGAIAVGFAAIFAKMAMNEGLGAVSSAAWRCFLAIPILLLAKKKFQKPEKNKFKKTNSLLLIFPGIIFGFDLATWHSSFQYTTAANATLLVNAAVILVSLYSWIFLKEKLRKIFWIGTALALLGIFMLVSSNSKLQNSSYSMYGDFLALITAFWYASYILITKNVRSKNSPLDVLLWVSIGASLVLFTTALIKNEPIWPSSINSWLCIIGLTFIVHLGGQGLIIYALAHVPASFASITLLLQPLSAAFLGWTFLSEPMTFGQGISAILVLTGIFMAKKGSG